MDAGNIAEWIGAVGEIAIAVGIVWELESGRRETFLDRAAKIKNYQDRAEIYAAFYATQGDSLAERSKQFCAHLWGQSDEGKLKKSCDSQIVLFGRLGQIRKRAMFFRNDYVKLFPHAVVLFWIMTAPYVDLRRKMTGEWWGCDFEFFARICLNFMLEENPQRTLTVHGNNPNTDPPLVISNAELRQLLTELVTRCSGDNLWES